MRKLFIASILVLTLCVTIFAQTDKISPCPTIDVISPWNVPVENEPMTFTATLSKEAEKFNLKYLWTVSSGEIIEGQGTLSVIVLQKDLWESLTATFKVVGLPKECAVTASATAPICECIGSSQVDEFSISVSLIDKARLDNLTIQLNNNPNANACIIEHFEKKTSRKAIAQKNKVIAGYLKRNGIETGRFVLLNALTGENMTQFFIVPAGATPPTCEDCITVELK